MGESNLFKADFHIHSQYSMDCQTSLKDIIKACQQKKINCIALADHGSIEGALKLREMAPFLVIIAEEILTTSGEIMGMFLNELIPSGLSIEESIRRIKDQGGLLCAQHPFDRFRPDALKAEIMQKIADQIDVVEVFNARTILMQTSRQAREFAREHSLPQVAGSDAHTAYEIGNAFVEMPEFKDKTEFLQALAKATIHGHRANLFSRVNTLWSKITRQ